jgi:hypothetical protein
VVPLLSYLAVSHSAYPLNNELGRFAYAYFYCILNLNYSRYLNFFLARNKLDVYLNLRIALVRDIVISRHIAGKRPHGLHDSPS